MYVLFRRKTDSGPDLPLFPSIVQKNKILETQVAT